MIVIDVETTGLNAKYHSLLSIGAVDLDKPWRQFGIDCRIRECAKVDLAALAVNGYTQERLRESLFSDKEALLLYLNWEQWSDDKTLAGENPARIDLQFMQETADIYHLPVDFGRRTIDLHTAVYLDHIRRGIKPPLKDARSVCNSDYSMTYVGLPNEPKPHTYGLTGAQYEAEAFSRLLYARGLFEEFAAHPLPEYLKKASSTVVRLYRKILPSERVVMT